MKNININDLYLELNRQKFISTSTLKQMGLNNYDIKKLVEENKLIRVNKGYYKTNIKSKDYDYNKSILKQARVELEKGNFEEVYYLISTYKHLNTSKNAHNILYLMYLLTKDYDKAKEELLKTMFLSKEKDTNKEYNLYMINLIIEKEKIIKELKKKL